MHFYHLHLIKSDTDKEVKRLIDNNMEGYHLDVYDYFSINKIQLDSESGITKVTQKNKEKIWKIIEKKIQYTHNCFEEMKMGLLGEMKRNNIHDLFTLGIANDRGGMVGFYLRQIGSFVSGYYTSNTYFYNWDTQTIKITKEEFEESVKEGDLYAIEIDLHN